MFFRFWAEINPRRDWLIADQVAFQLYCHCTWDLLPSQRYGQWHILFLSDEEHIGGRFKKFRVCACVWNAGTISVIVTCLWSIHCHGLSSGMWMSLSIWPTPFNNSGFIIVDPFLVNSGTSSHSRLICMLVQPVYCPGSLPLLLATLVSGLESNW